MSKSHKDFTFYIASDLHYGKSRKGDAATHRLAQYVLENPANALLLGGDLGKDQETLRECLSLFESFEGPKLAVPGNHDIWLDPTWPTEDSWELYQTFLPAVFQEHGFHPLHIQPFVVNDLAFVGSMGWYDYSFRDDIDIDYACYETKTPPWAPMPIWNDATYAQWPMDDVALTERLCQHLQQQLLQVQHAKTVVGLIHHVVTKALLVHPRSMVPLHWRYANAFLGSEQLGDVFRNHPQTSQVFCGHIHMERSTKMDHVHCTTVGGSYKEKQLILASASQIHHKQMFTAEAES